MFRAERERKKTRWLQVCSSYICVLIDVIILVVNIRLRDKTGNEGGEREGDVFRYTEKHESKSRDEGGH